MLLAREIAPRPDDDLGRAWEALARSSSESGFMQGLSWAAFKRRQGLQTVHLGLFEGEALVGGAIAYAAPRLAGAGFLISPDGPVLPWDDEERARQGLRVLDAAFAEVARERGAIAWRIEPRVAPPQPRVLRNFKRAPVDLLPAQSLVLDLAPSPEALLAAMRPKGRYNIRLAARKGVVVDELPPGEGLDVLYDLLEQAAERDGFFLEPRAYFAQLLETLGPTGHARVFAARGAETPAAVPGRALGALLMLVHGTRATYLYGGIANHDRPRMAGYALQWSAIQRARALGCHQYDFYGFDPIGRPGHLYARFSRFKRQFGGRPVQYIGAHEHFYLDRLADAVVQAVREIGWN